MSPKAQRIAIAETMGARTGYRPTIIGPELWVMAPSTAFWNRYASIRPEEEYGSHYLPSFLTDLNAMHEAEKVLTEDKVNRSSEDQRCRYIRHLGKIVGCWRSGQEHNSLFQQAHATATQRAEAFLRTLNLWDDSK